MESDFRAEGSMGFGFKWERGVGLLDVGNRFLRYLLDDLLRGWVCEIRFVVNGGRNAVAAFVY